MLISSTSTTANNSAATVAAAVATAVVAVQLLTPADPIGRCVVFFKQLRGHESRLTSSSNVNDGIDAYNKLHHSESVEERNAQYKSLVNSYYDLATVFYEWGWGTSFHFAERLEGVESFAESIRRHEYQLASKLNITSTSGKSVRILDVGCGIGGPMRNIARFLQCRITGLTLNPYQVDRGNELSQQDSTVAHLAKSEQGDFMQMPFENDEYDAAYAIEATCHAPDRVGVYSEIFRVLKPGAIFACYEWCMTDLYDPTNSEHQSIKKQIEEGDGLPDICHTSVCLKALQEAGFEVLEAVDVADPVYKKGYYPWMLPLMPSWNPFSQRFQFNWLGYRMTNAAICMMEFLRLAPKGTVKTQRMLQQGGFGLAAGGDTGIFTPMYLMVGRVPLDKNETSGQ